MDRVQEAKKLLAKIRGANLKPIRQMELDNVVGFFDEHVRQHAKPSEETQFDNAVRSEEHTSELQSLMRISYAVFCLKKKNKTTTKTNYTSYLNNTTSTKRKIYTL